MKRVKRNDTRAVSAIVTAAFILLISVSSISVFWIGVLPIIQDRIELEALCHEATKNVYYEDACIAETETGVYNQILDGLIAGDLKWNRDVGCATNIGALSYQQQLNYLESIFNDGDPAIENCHFFIWVDDNGNGDIEESEVQQTLDDVLNYVQAEIRLTVRRSVSDFALTDLQVGAFWLSQESDTAKLIADGIEGITPDDIPGSNEQKLIAFDYGILGALYADSMFLAPIVSFNGKDKLCEATDTIPLEICPDVLAAL